MNSKVKICDNEAESQDGPVPKEEVMDNSKNVFKLPPELLTKILLFCDGDDVVNFAQASLINGVDIENVISNKKLWEHPVISLDVKFIKYLGSHTKSLYIDYTKMTKPREIPSIDVSKDFMKSLRTSCIALEKLMLKNIEERPKQWLRHCVWLQLLEQKWWIMEYEVYENEITVTFRSQKFRSLMSSDITYPYYSTLQTYSNLQLKR